MPNFRSRTNSNSRDLIPNEELLKEKKIYCFPNGKRDHEGFELIVDPKVTKTLDQLKFKLTHVRPKSGLIRQIFDSKGNKITEIQNLQNGEKYLCCGSEKFDSSVLPFSWAPVISNIPTNQIAEELSKTNNSSILISNPSLNKPSFTPYTPLATTGRSKTTMSPSIPMNFTSSERLKSTTVNNSITTKSIDSKTNNSFISNNNSSISNNNSKKPSINVTFKSTASLRSIYEESSKNQTSDSSKRLFTRSNSNSFAQRNSKVLTKTKSLSTIPIEKTITCFPNGVKDHPGVEVFINPNEIKTLDQLKLMMAQKGRSAKLGIVRHIFTFTGEKIINIEDIMDKERYICSTSEKVDLRFMASASSSTAPKEETTLKKIYSNLPSQKEILKPKETTTQIITPKETTTQIITPKETTTQIITPKEIITTQKETKLPKEMLNIPLDSIKEKEMKEELKKIKEELQREEELQKQLEIRKEQERKLREAEKKRLEELDREFKKQFQETVKEHQQLEKQKIKLEKRVSRGSYDYNELPPPPQKSNLYKITQTEYEHKTTIQKQTQTLDKLQQLLQARKEKERGIRELRESNELQKKEIEREEEEKERKKREDQQELIVGKLERERLQLQRDQENTLDKMEKLLRARKEKEKNKSLEEIKLVPDNNKNQNLPINEDEDSLSSSSEFESPHDDEQLFQSKEKLQLLKIQQKNKLDKMQELLRSRKKEEVEIQKRLSILSKDETENSENENLENSPSIPEKQQQHELEYLSQDELEGNIVKCPVATALYQFKARVESELSFKSGDKIAICGHRLEVWYRGQNLSTLHFGWFPSNYVSVSKSETIGIYVIPDQFFGGEEEEEYEKKEIKIKEASYFIQKRQEELARKGGFATKQDVGKKRGFIMKKKKTKD